jgi:hypothetical protein
MPSAAMAAMAAGSSRSPYKYCANETKVTAVKTATTDVTAHLFSLEERGQVLNRHVPTWDDSV